MASAIPAVEMRLTLYSMALSLHVQNSPGAVNVANRALFSRPAIPSTARLKVSCAWIQPPHQTQPCWAPAVHDSRLPLRLLPTVLQTPKHRACERAFGSD